MSKGTPMLTVRCPPDLRKAARETAEANGTNLTEVVLGFLQRYVERGVNTPEPSVRTCRSDSLQAEVNALREEREQLIAERDEARRMWKYHQDKHGEAWREVLSTRVELDKFKPQ